MFAKKHLALIITLFIAAMMVTPTLAQQRDTDGDGLPDSDDNCPTEAGPRANSGCPYVIVLPPTNPDTDGDGLPDSDDNCPTVAGPRENGGCPQTAPPNNPPPTNPDPNNPPSSNPDPNNPPPSNPDRDGDGVPDSDDRCPDDAGTVDNGGCPEPVTPPFTPPLLSNDACFVTTSGDFQARVRVLPGLEEEHIGDLLPGVIYPAQGIVNTSDGAWIKLDGEFQHLNYEMWGGTDGYVSDSVVNHSDCPTIDEPISTVDDFQAPQLQLCHLTVGYDSTTWSEAPEVPDYVYASFWFAAAPGEDIPAGTAAWGVIYVAPYITLEDSNNVVAAATDPAIMQAALDSDYAGAFNWPTENGAIVSGSQTLYRLTGAAGGNCGEIIGDDFNPPITSRPTQEDMDTINVPIDQYACTMTTPFNWIFAFNAAPGADVPVGTSPLSIISGDVENFGDVSEWKTELRTLGDEIVEYMTYGEIGDTEYRSFPRTGGTCGAIGNVGRPFRTVVFDPITRDGTVDAQDFAIWRENYGATDDDDSWILILAEFDDSSDEPEVVEICYYVELYEVGVWNEVCVEIEVPEGCELVASEAGVYHLDCDDPVVAGFNAADAFATEAPDDGTAIGVQMQLIFVLGGTGRDCNNNGIDDLDEFWPPDCLELTIGDGGNAASDDDNEITDADLDWFWQQCPDGWVYDEETGLECEPLVIDDD